MFKIKNEKPNSDNNKENKTFEYNNNNELKQKPSIKRLGQEKMDNEEVKSSSVLRNAVTQNFFNKLDSPLENQKIIDMKNPLATYQKVSSNSKTPLNNIYNYSEDMMNLHLSINDSDRKTKSNFNYNANKHENNPNTPNTALIAKPESLSNLSLNNFSPSTTNRANIEDRFTNTNFSHATSNFNNTYPSLITPQLLKNLRNNNASDSNRTKQPINLEDLCIQEEKIWHILEAIRFNANISSICDDYYDFQNVSSLLNLDCYFHKLELKTQIRISGTLEIYSIVCLSLLILKNKLDTNSLSHLKNLMYFVHQSFTFVLNTILSKLPKEFLDNMWVIKLKKVLASRSSKHDDDDYNSIKTCNSFIISMLKKLIYTYFKSKEDADLFSILEDVLSNINKYSHNTVRNIMFNIRHTLIQYKIMNQSSMNFANITEPYLPPLPKKDRNNTYTLVLDLDETLVHYVSIAGAGELMIRPGAESFIDEMAKHYEVIVFTAAMQDYADSILDTIDPKKNLIKHRLYRHHASINKNTYVKDISKLGRNLAKTIIIDNVWENFQLQSENGIFIRTWVGDENDRNLPDLAPLLRDFVTKKVPDVRKALRRFRDTLFRLFINGDQNPYETVRKYLDTESE